MDITIIGTGNMARGIATRALDGGHGVTLLGTEQAKADALAAELPGEAQAGAVGAVSMRDGRPFSVAAVTVNGGRIVEMDFLVDPERLAQLDLTVLDD